LFSVMASTARAGRASCCVQQRAVEFRKRCGLSSWRHSRGVRRRCNAGAGPTLDRVIVGIREASDRPAGPVNATVVRPVAQPGRPGGPSASARGAGGGGVVARALAIAGGFRRRLLRGSVQLSTATKKKNKRVGISGSSASPAFPTHEPQPRVTNTSPASSPRKVTTAVARSRRRCEHAEIPVMHHRYPNTKSPSHSLRRIPSSRAPPEVFRSRSSPAAGQPLRGKSVQTPRR